MRADERTGTYPLSQYVLKVHSRCDLACDHCYVYEHADQSWRGRPVRMSLETLAAAAQRIAQHATTHALPRVTLVLHGGEPLLLGHERIREMLVELRATVGSVTGLRLRMQSNGVQLDEAYCELFVEHGLQVGISLDGDRAANDRHRRYSNGRSSHPQVRHALELLRRPEFRPAYAGILCTVDLRNDPLAVYSALMDEDPPAIDLLLPHATWDHPPPRPDGSATPYADWLTAIHRSWTAGGRRVPIRMFDAVHRIAGGGSSTAEAFGLDPKDLAVVETDGTWEQVDSLKTAFDGAAWTGLDVFSHSVDEVARQPAIADRQRGADALNATCRACPVLRQCGGGLFAHRFRSGSSFDNPSVYCADLKELIHSMNRDRAPASKPATPADESAAALRVLDDVAGGFGSAAGVAALADLELGITRGLVWGVAGRHPAATATAVPVLVALDRARSPALSRVLRHPLVRVWATNCLHGRTDAGHLAAIAAAAAIRAGEPVELDVPARDGRVFLPTLGAYEVPWPAVTTVRLRAGDGRVTVAAPGERPVRLMNDSADHKADSRADHDADGRADHKADHDADHKTDHDADGRTDHKTDDGGGALHVTLDGIEVLIEDADPHRDCFDWPAGPASTPAQRRRWTEALRQAWQVVRRDATRQVPGLRAGLRAVVPLAPGDPGELHSSSAQDAFGAVATQLCPPEVLALQLVHEYQHSKMAALFDIDAFTLFDRSDPRLLAVGWRADPRPVSGVLQGTYAHIAVADVWRVRAGREPGAAAEFARYRQWCARAVDALLACGALTPTGERLVHGMGRTVAAWDRPSG